MNLVSWFERGMTAQEYVDNMENHQTNLIHIYENFSVPTEDAPIFERIQKKKLRAVVLTEDWCGDAMLNIPIYLRIAEVSHIPTHFLLRDQNLELMDRYLTNGRSRSIPIIIFFDNTGKEVGRWGPRAPELQHFLDESLANLPQPESADYQKKKQEALTFITKAFRDHQEFWHHVYTDILKTIR
ncbi:thioredoxin family protein [Halobacillus fulvus]|nr:thioredoxin family protein [Halobacillus fulvus]